MEEEKITSNIIKTSLINNLCLVKGQIAATEISYMMYQADVLSFPKRDKNKLVEYEVKISKSDLENDFIKKEMKHNILLNPKEEHKKTLEVPNYFYFAIPFELIKPCQELLIKYNKPKYGIAVYSEYNLLKKDNEWTLTDKKINAIQDRIFIVKPARKLFEPDSYEQEINNIQYKILLRLMYQQCDHMKEKYFHIGGWDSPDTVAKLKKEIKHLREGKEEQIKDISLKYWNSIDYDLKIEIDKVLDTKWSGYCKFNKLMSIIQRQKERNNNEDKQS